VEARLLPGKEGEAVPRASPPAAGPRWERWAPQPLELPEQDREEAEFGFEVESPQEAGPRWERWQESFPSVIRITKGEA
jgi:hypothetical protein